MKNYTLQSIVQVNFLVVQAPSEYNAIFGWLGLNAFQAIMSTYCLKVKFPMMYGVEKFVEIKT